jgi:hypothetical protein
MNCTEVEPFLDQLINGAGGCRIPDEANVRLHVASCSLCQQTLCSMEQWDHQLRQSMSDVVVPDGLNTRLTKRLEAATQPGLLEQRVRPRTRLRQWSAVCAALIFCTLSVWWVATQRGGQRLSAANIAILWDATPETATAQSFVARKLPRSWATLNNVSSQGWMQARLRDLHLVVDGFHFEVRTPHAEPEPGWLFVIPRSRWASAPASLPSMAQLHYSPDRVWIAWNEGETVYVLALMGSPQTLERLQRRLDGDQAVF